MAQEKLTIKQKLQSWGSFIRFSHTLFSLPFAIAAFIYARKVYDTTFIEIIPLLICMVAARSFGMSFNRIADRAIDAKNPRTTKRELVTGILKVDQAIIFCLSSAVIFVTAAAFISPTCGYLSFLVLAILCLYSLSKRFTAFCHIILGISLGIAPAAVWFAVTRDAGIVPWLFLASVACWVAGFDILYSLLDRDFDLREHLYSIPTKFGVQKSVLFSRSLHAISIILFLALGRAIGSGIAYYVGVIAFAAFLLAQHLSVKKQNLKALEPSFFALSGWASFVFLIGAALDQFHS